MNGQNQIKILNFKNRKPCANNQFLLVASLARTVSEQRTSCIQTVLLVSSFAASINLAKINHSIGLPLTGSLDLLREALSLRTLDLTLGRTTNNSCPQGAQFSIIHTDLPWLQFSYIFSQIETWPCAVDMEHIATTFPAAHLTMFLF